MTGACLRAAQWMLDSGIQEPSGGIARYHHADEARNERVSTEITGYGVSTFAYLFNATKDEIYLDRARAAAQFLWTHGWDPVSSAMRFECEGPLAHLAYLFDTGIIARGFLALWHATQEQRWLDAAVACGRSLVRDFALHEPVIELPSKAAAPRDARWSRSSGCYQLKSTMCLEELAVITGEASMRRAFESVLEVALKNQAAFLPGDEGHLRVMDRLHAYCYFLEAIVWDQEHCLVVAAGIERVAYWIGALKGEFERSDVYAQLVRVRLWAVARGVPLDSYAAATEVSALTEFQYEAGGHGVIGSFCFGERGGQRTPFANPVSTAFAIQALDMWDRHLKKLPLPARHELI